MALWFPIMVNQFEVGRVQLVRIAPVDHSPAENEDCTYTLRYYEGDHLVPSFEGMVKHPYLTKNPLPLIQSALEEING